MSKVKLRRKSEEGLAPTERMIEIREALPFFVSPRCKFVHRLKTGGMLFDGDRYLFTAFMFWCNGYGCSSNGILSGEIPDGALICARCEAKAIAAGELSSPRLCAGVEDGGSPAAGELRDDWL